MLKEYIVITGATGNIGNKLAHYLLTQGKSLILTSRNEKHLKEMQGLFSEHQDNVLLRKLDLSDKESIESFADSIRQLNVVSIVNNAATDNLDRIDTITYESIWNIVNINYVGTAYITKLLVEQSVSKKQGLNIVNISSLLSVYGAMKSAAYSASKAALEAFTRNLTVEYASKGIVCNTIRVAGISGELNVYGTETRVVRYDEQPALENQKNDKSHIPAKRFVAFNEINKLVEFLLSKDVSYLNGQSINLDGGISIQYPGYAIE